jgi:hypothetical protein
MRPLRELLVLAALAAVFSVAGAQDSGFDLQAYKQFLATHRNLESSQLQLMHYAGTFEPGVPSTASDPAYLDAITQAYSLTSFELEQIRNHGFVVTSRLAGHTFVEKLWDVYHKDLPVFVSTDAILQAVHNSYDLILQEVERATLCPELLTVLAGLHGELPALKQQYGGDARMLEMLRDVDVYLTVPLRLLGRSDAPHFSDNAAWVDQLLQYIQLEAPQDIPLFASTLRTVDFSQFTLRGHYTKDTTLARYFRAMMWLGKTEIYLSAPKGTTTAWPDEDIQRQTIDAALIAEAVDSAAVAARLNRMDGILRFFVGDPDNVTLENLTAVMQQAGVQTASDLLDTALCRQFRTLLLQNSFAFQRINSQILYTDPFSIEQLEPASAFLLLGQRFVIDSYVLGNVVYDKILYQGSKVTRMLPSTLDVLFALGNDAAAQLLAGELNQYHYSTNLAALRYLVDSYDESFWTGSMFNAWLRMIRTLNPPLDRTGLPAFMQTAAWWQEKMNTQLGSWAQLRHDNLLYAKQSYTGGIICSFPQSYVEPIPEFFTAVKNYADTAAARFAGMGMPLVRSYFQVLSGVADTLGGIARKELEGTPLSAAESVFLRRMLVTSSMCGDPYTGWYPAIYYGMSFVPGDSDRKTDFVVADVHTAPTDAAGNEMGWVLHVGTGPVDMAVICAPLPGVGRCAFVGPVMNYYEHLSTNYKRLTDEEWATMYNMPPSLRPAFINAYSADEKGESRGVGPLLLTGIGNSPVPSGPVTFSLSQNFPNPFNASTIIPFSLRTSSASEQTTLEIYDMQGRVVARLLDGRLPAGNYTVRWDGNAAGRVPVASGVYFYRLKIGDAVATRKLTVLR